MSDARIKVTVDARRLHYGLVTLLGLEYVGAREISLLLGIDRRAAGRLLAAMARMGLAVRWSRTYYKLIYPIKNLMEDHQR